MAAASYDQALTRLLKDEGGYSDHPADPGGPTNFGITLADARRYWKGNATADDVRAMPQTIARKIYREQYWTALRCDELAAGVDYAVFDYGVNSGVSRAGKVLRRALKLSDRTSTVSDEVVAAATAASAPDLIELICMERMSFLRGLKTWPVFGNGWARRVAGVRTAALAMAAGSQPSRPPPSVASGAPGKAVAPVNTAACTASAVVVAAGTAIAAAHASSLRAVLIILGVGCLGIAAAVAFWQWRQRRRQLAPATPDIIS